VHSRFEDLLVDPVDGSPLRLQISEFAGDEIITGALLGDSGRKYPIIRGIPRFVDSGYASSFGLQWNRYAQSQLDSVRRTGHSRERFVHEVVDQVGSIQGKVIVDAGCGAGRFSEVAVDLGATTISVDLSSAVDATAGNLGLSDRSCVIQADITHLPLAMDRVDGIFSIGVVQHTPAPYSTLARLAEQLSPDSWLAVTAYGRKWFTKLHAKYLVRPATKRIDKEHLLQTIQTVMPRIFDPTEAAVTNEIFGRLIAFGLPVAVYPRRDNLTRDQRLLESIVDTFDMLSPAYDNPLRAERAVRAVQPFLEEVRLVSRQPLILSGSRRP